MVKFETKFDAEKLKVANKLSTKRWIWLLLLIPLLCTCIGIIKTIMGTDDGTMIVSNILYGIIVVLLYLLFIKILQKIQIKNIPLLGDETKTEYIFEEDNFTINQHNDAKNYFSTEKAGYGVINRVYITKTHYFICPTIIQVHVIPKSDLASGDLEELNKILVAKLGKRVKFV